MFELNAPWGGKRHASSAALQGKLDFAVVMEEDKKFAHRQEMDLPWIMCFISSWLKVSLGAPFRWLHSMNMWLWACSCKQKICMDSSFVPGYVLKSEFGSTQDSTSRGTGLHAGRPPRWPEGRWGAPRAARWSEGQCGQQGERWNGCWTHSTGAHDTSHSGCFLWCPWCSACVSWNKEGVVTTHTFLITKRPQRGWTKDAARCGPCIVFVHFTHQAIKAMLNINVSLEFFFLQYLLLFIHVSEILKHSKELSWSGQPLFEFIVRNRRRLNKQLTRLFL